MRDACARFPVLFAIVTYRNSQVTYINKKGQAQPEKVFIQIYNKEPLRAWGCVFTLKKTKDIVDFFFLDNTPNPSVIALLPLQIFTPL